MTPAPDNPTGRRIAFGMLALAVVAGVIILAFAAALIGSWLRS